MRNNHRTNARRNQGDVDRLFTPSLPSREHSRLQMGKREREKRKKRERLPLVLRKELLKELREKS